MTALLLFVVSVAANAYDFNMKNDDGKTIYYNILSSSDKTCEVTYQMIVPGGDVGINRNAYSGDVVIPETVQYYGTYSVVGIGDDAFVCCEGLTSVSIPNSVTYIGDNAFDWCTGLTQVNIPESVTTIGSGAFSLCSGLTGEMVIPNSVTTIGNAAFEDCSGLASVTIGDKVTSIGFRAFRECTGLTGEMVIPNSVTTIGYEAFYKCTGLTSVTLGNSVTEIGYSAFENCTGLTGELVIPNSMTTIGEDAFSWCAGLTSLTLGNSVTTIGNYAFSYCTGLTGTLTIPESVTTIGSYAFSSCRNLTGTLTLGNSVTTIGSSAFGGCSGLTGVLTIPESVTTIGNYAFRNCSGLTSATIGNSVTTIGNYAFSGCTGLTEVTIGESVTSICIYAFENCTGLTEISIPNSVTAIGYDAFWNCTGLTSVTLGNSVTSIGTGAFYATNLKEIYSKNLTPPYILEDTFYKVDKNTCILYVPVNSKNAYSTADYWSEFFNIEGMTFDDVLFVQTYEASEVTTRSVLLRGLVTVGDEDVLEQGFEYWADDGEVQTVTSPDLIMAVTLTGLEDGVTYTYRAYAITGNNTVYGEEMTFTTKKAPTVQTYEASEVTTISALLRGVVTVGEEEVLEQGFEYWTEEGDVQTVTSPDLIMAVTLTGLEDGVTYTYRAYATTESGTTYGEEMTFTTIKAPTVQTYEVTEITENSALLKGYVTAGNEDLLGQGFEYWAAGGEVQTIAMADQMMAATITGLNEGTTYTCRAYAKTASGTTYGNEVTFTTLGTSTITPPTVQTYAAADVTENSATLSGVVAAGSEKVTEQGFEYWSSSNDVQTVASTSSSMSVTVTNLKSNTIYTYRAYAITASGTTYGENVSFTTLENTDGVSYVNADLEEEARYTTDGKKVSQPQRGVNIVRYSDGTAKKVLVK